MENRRINHKSLENCDFKAQTLELYGEQIWVMPKPNTATFNLYGERLSGRLIGRVWGEKIENGTNIQTVIGITLLMEIGELEIPCSEIISLGKQ